MTTQEWDLSERLGRLREALTRARSAEQLQGAMLEEGFLGISGDAGVGKSTLITWSEVMLTVRERATIVHVDLNGAYSLAKLVARWRHAVLRAIVGPIAASHAAGLPREYWPASTEGAMLRARSLLADQYEAALRSEPKKGERPESIEEPLDMTVELARGGRTCVLVIDHLEAPMLTSRHPLVPQDLLWQIRAAAQRVSDLHVTVVCAAGAESVAAGEDSAFYGDGRWLTIHRPAERQWEVAGAAAAVPIDPDLLRLGRGHVETTLQLIRASLERGLNAQDTFASVANSQREHAARCLAHANSLHRLGAQVLMSIANGDGPYAGTPDARSDDVATAVGQLRLAGLIRRDPRDSRGWLLVDPLVRWLLADAMNLHEDDPMFALKGASLATADVLNAVQTLHYRNEPTTAHEIAVEIGSDEAGVRLLLRNAVRDGLVDHDRSDSEFALTRDGERRLIDFMRSA